MIDDRDLIRDPEEIPPPIVDVGGPVTRVNVWQRIALSKAGLPDPIRESDFDPERTHMRLVWTLNPNMMQPRIEESFGAGKVQMIPVPGIPRGSHAAGWDWDTERVNIRRPSVTSYGSEVDDAQAARSSQA